MLRPEVLAVDSPASTRPFDLLPATASTWPALGLDAGDNRIQV
ncbi:MAG TPA: hypothetical protein VKF17_20490 [Isosphaeraceae bacterium]|nr:hypothetical protein [Isosphaeraceae bacterium]